MLGFLCFLLGISITMNIIICIILYKLKDKKEIEEVTVNKEERNSFFS